MMRLGGVQALSGELSRAAGTEEVEILRARPTMLSVVLASGWRLLLCALVIAGGVWALVSGAWQAVVIAAIGAGVGGALWTLAWGEVERRATRYQLTDRRAVWSGGVVRRFTVEVPLARVQQIGISQGVLERALGIGTVRLRSGADGAPPVSWRWITRPEAAAEQVRAAIAGYAGAGRAPDRLRDDRGACEGAGDGGQVRRMGVEYPSSSDGRGERAMMPVIGLAGGIGSGKSTVARAFQSLGCYVIDSDARAREALDRHEVSSTIVCWWGQGMLDDRGKVDRAKVAQIVFASPDQRARLEALVHPIVRQERARMLAEAARFWAAAAIVDAPLLFEAGVDKECDAVVFVDAPLAERLERVKRSRGWSDAELARREAAQWPLEKKRALCRFVIDNSDGRSQDGSVERRAGEILRELRGVDGRPDQSGQAEGGNRGYTAQGQG